MKLPDPESLKGRIMDVMRAFLGEDNDIAFTEEKPPDGVLSWVCRYVNESSGYRFRTLQYILDTKAKILMDIASASDGAVPFRVHGSLTTYIGLSSLPVTVVVFTTPEPSYVIVPPVKT